MVIARICIPQAIEEIFENFMLSVPSSIMKWCATFIGPTVC